MVTCVDQTMGVKLGRFQLKLCEMVGLYNQVMVDKLVRSIRSFCKMAEFKWIDSTGSRKVAIAVS